KTAHNTSLSSKGFLQIMCYPFDPPFVLRRGGGGGGGGGGRVYISFELSTHKQIVFITQLHATIYNMCQMLRSIITAYLKIFRKTFGVYYFSFL
ncbi:hypothetical protein ACJX0J_035982, partial [Zea mays]